MINRVKEAMGGAFSLHKEGTPVRPDEGKPYSYEGIPNSGLRGNLKEFEKVLETSQDTWPLRIIYFRSQPYNLALGMTRVQLGEFTRELYSRGVIQSFRHRSKWGTPADTIDKDRARAVAALNWTRETFILGGRRESPLRELADTTRASLGDHPLASLIHDSTDGEAMLNLGTLRRKKSGTFSPDNFEEERQGNGRWPSTGGSSMDLSGPDWTANFDKVREKLAKREPSDS